MAAGVLASALLHGQTAAPVSFEVASVKPAEPLDPAKLMSGEQKIGLTLDAARVEFHATTMATLVETAYQVKTYQVSGPEWMNSERYDVIAKMPENARRADLPRMLQTLLAERFGLVVHRINKDVRSFALVVARSGPRLKESPPKSAGEEGPNGGGVLRSDTSLSTKGVVTHAGPDGTVTQTVGPSGMHLDIVEMTMPGLATMLGNLTQRPVRNETNLAGKYDFVLDLSREELASLTGRGTAVASVDSGAELNEKTLDASLDHLGLKLDRRQVPVEMLVIDQLEKVPTKN